MKLRNVLAVIKLRRKTGSPSLRRIMTDKNGMPNTKSTNLIITIYYLKIRRQNNVVIDQIHRH